MAAWKNLTQHFVLGYFHRVPMGLISLSLERSCAIPGRDVLS